MEIKGPWDTSFEVLENYIKANEGIPMSNTIYKGINIGYWWSRQCQALANGKLDDERKAKIESIISIYGQTNDNTASTANETTEKSDTELKKAKEKDTRSNTGSKSINKEKKETNTSVKVPENKQEKSQLEAKKLEPADNRPSAYESAEMKTADVPDKKVSAEEPTYILDKKASEQLAFNNIFENEQPIKGKQQKGSWEERFELYKEYIKETGKNPIFSTMYKGYSIGQWCSLQRRLFKYGQMPEERIVKLTNAGFNFEVPYNGCAKDTSDIWEEKYKIYKEYIAKTNKQPVATTIYKGIKLGAWCVQQRRIYKEGRLKEEYIKKLADMNFYFGKPPAFSNAEAIKAEDEHTVLDTNEETLKDSSSANSCMDDITAQQAIEHYFGKSPTFSNAKATNVEDGHTVLETKEETAKVSSSVSSYIDDMTEQQEIELSIYIDLVRDNLLNADIASQRINMSIKEFKNICAAEEKGRSKELKRLVKKWKSEGKSDFEINELLN